MLVGGCGARGFASGVLHVGISGASTVADSAATARALGDRRVHAECATFEVVRYERAGKWFVESKVPLVPAEHVGVGEAARRAMTAEALGGEINYGIPGGQVFDRKVEKLGV